MENKSIKLTVLVMGFFCILAGVFSCLFNSVAGGGVVIATGLILFLLSQFEIEYFKMPGLEAKLRKTIHQAEVTLEALRNIIIPIAENSISLAARTGRMDVASSHKELHDLSMRIKQELIDIEVSDYDLNKVLHDWYFFTSFDMGRLIVKSLTHRLEEKQKIFNKETDDWVGGKPVTDQARFAELLEPARIASREIEEARNCLWRKNYEDMPVIIERCINSNVTLNEVEKKELWKEVEEQWLDLTCFVNTKELRRKEQWFAKEV